MLEAILVGTAIMFDIPTFIESFKKKEIKAEYKYEPIYQFVIKRK